MLRSILRRAIKAQKPYQMAPSWNPKTNPTFSPSPFHHFSSKTKKNSAQKQKPGKKTSSAVNSSADSAAQTTAGLRNISVVSDPVANRRQQLAEDEKNPSLDLGPNGFPLFTSTPSLSQLTRIDACSYFKFSEKELKAVLPEGLPKGMVVEFEESMRSSLLVRKSFLDLRDNFRRIVDPPLRSSDGKGVIFFGLFFWFNYGVILL
uniref:Small ribosomal subunit protein mS29 n=1 Tax=Rhizophora mucronata TaxID=61149 RepID=A0A2P2JPN9_RHIMU